MLADGCCHSRLLAVVAVIAAVKIALPCVRYQSKPKTQTLILAQTDTCNCLVISASRCDCIVLGVFVGFCIQAPFIFFFFFLWVACRDRMRLLLHVAPASGRYSYLIFRAANHDRSLKQSPPMSLNLRLQVEEAPGCIKLAWYKATETNKQEIVG